MAESVLDVVLGSPALKRRWLHQNGAIRLPIMATSFGPCGITAETQLHSHSGRAIPTERILSFRGICGVA